MATVNPAPSPRARAFLCPVDDTEDSEHAVSWVLSEMYKPGDVIHVYHCTPTPAPELMPGVGLMDGVVTFNASPEGVQDLVDAAKSMVEQRFVPILKRAGAPYEVHIAAQRELEPVGAAICRVAGEVDAFAIVMTSHRKSRLLELFLGSVAKYTTSHARNAVVVLHDPK